MKASKTAQVASWHLGSLILLNWSFSVKGGLGLYNRVQSSYKKFTLEDGELKDRGL